MSAGDNAITVGTAAVIFGGQSVEGGELLNDVWVLSGSVEESPTKDG